MESKIFPTHAIIWKMFYCSCQGFPNSSVGKESACNAGDSSSIPRSGRFAGKGIGYLLQYSWVSLVAQPAKNPPAMQETWVRSLGWKIPCRRERLSTPVFWPGESHGLYSSWGHKDLDTTKWLSLSAKSFCKGPENIYLGPYVTATESCHCSKKAITDNM